MPDLPSGTVAFLFTDIEGSTESWERDRVAMAAAVAQHLALLKAAIEEHNGVLFKVVGDAVQAAFPTAPQAVAAAVDSQRALLAEKWGELGPIQVRMALHAGEAIPNDRADYLAAPLNRLSRLLSTGYGGQILLSQTVQQLTRGALPPRVELRDLGEHRLRDLLEPERVFQLRHPDLQADFPPLKSLGNRLNSLPRQPTPFLGREREISDVVGLLQRDDVQLLTLIGPGGTGKTRLALQAAADLLDDFADGVFFVPLAPLSDPNLVLSTVATTLGIREEGEHPLGERLHDLIAGKQVLLVLDNMEHLVEAAPAVGELLAASPGLKVLATSRVPLRLRAEREYPVSPLGLPRRKPPPPPEQLSQYEAVRLFIDRAQAVKPNFAIDNETAPAVAEICHRLDGLPLAIELAAARVRMLSPQAMLARLEQRLPLLTSGARDAPERQRTLRNTIAWSYDLLAPEEQTLFRRLAVFAGGATFESVEAVANPDGDLDVFGGLERLLEHNLLRLEEGLEGEPRFTMLETIREFGLEQLEASREVDATRQRHAERFLEFAARAEPELIGLEQGEWLQRFATEHDNVRVALGWALDHEPDTVLRLSSSLGRFWWVRGELSEGRQWLKQALDASPTPGRDSSRQPAVFWSGVLAAEQGDYREASTRFEESLALARTRHDVRGMAQVLTRLAWVEINGGDLEQALRYGSEALTLSREAGDQAGVSDALNALGVAARDQGRLEEATQFYTEALHLARELGDRSHVARVLHNLGEVSRDEGHVVRAAALYGESLALRSQLDERSGIADCLTWLGGIAGEYGKADLAARLFGAAAKVFEEIGVAGVDPPVRPIHDRDVAVVRGLLGEEAFATAWQAGRASTIEEAVTEALALADELTQR